MDENGEEEGWRYIRDGSLRGGNRKLYSTALRGENPPDSHYQQNSSRRNFYRSQQRGEQMTEPRGYGQFNSQRRNLREQPARFRWRRQREEDPYFGDQQRERKYLKSQPWELRRPTLQRRPPLHAFRGDNGRIRRTEQTGTWWRNQRRSLNATRSNMDTQGNTTRTDFTNKVRLFHKIIKSVHHLKNVTQKQAPKALLRITQQLINTIKPAMPTDRTLDLIQGNARNWELTTVIILTDHYKDSLESLKTELHLDPTEDWSEAFEIAANWAKRRLGRRLLPETVQEAEEIIEKGLSNVEETNGLQQIGREAPRESRQCTTHVQTVGKMDFPPLQKNITVIAQVHRSSSSPGDIISPWTDDPEDTLHMDIGPRQQQQPTTRTTQTPEAPVAQRLRQRNNGGNSATTSEIAGSRPPDNVGLHRTEMENGFILPTGFIREEPQESPREQRQGRDYTRHRNWTTSEISHPRASLMEDTPQPSRNNGLISPTGSTSREMEGMDRPGSQSRSQQTDEWNWSLSETSSKGRPSRPRPTRHAITDRKKKDWEVEIREKHVILGDSNVSKIPPFNFPDLQIDSFPGATFRHMQAVLEKVDCNPEVENIIFSLGINNRKQKLLTTTKEIQRLYKVTSEKFPNAEIIFPLINFARNLPFKEQEFLQNLNRHLKQKYRTLSELPRTEFDTERDGIHWTQKTAKRILNYWIEQGNE